MKVPTTQSTFVKKYWSSWEKLHVVSFDLKFEAGYFVAAREICFVDTDNIKSELMCIKDNGRQLWCNGKESVVLLHAVDAPVPKKKKDEQKVNALEQKVK